MSDLKDYDYTKDSQLNDEMIRSSSPILETKHTDNIDFEGENESTFSSNAFNINAKAILFGGVFMITGLGTPLNVIAAPLGSIYFNRSGGANTSIYVKETQVVSDDKTGWVAK